MEPKIMTKEELIKSVNANLTQVNEADLKWIYCYFNEFDEWPITISDSTEDLKKEEELCPMD
jgi:hypothetical protein